MDTTLTIEERVLGIIESMDSDIMSFMDPREEVELIHTDDEEKIYRVSLMYDVCINFSLNISSNRIGNIVITFWHKWQKTYAKQICWEINKYSEFYATTMSFCKKKEKLDVEKLMDEKLTKVIPSYKKRSLTI